VHTFEKALRSSGFEVSCSDAKLLPQDMAHLSQEHVAAQTLPTHYKNILNGASEQIQATGAAMPLLAPRPASPPCLPLPRTANAEDNANEKEIQDHVKMILNEVRPPEAA